MVEDFDEVEVVEEFDEVEVVEETKPVKKSSPKLVAAKPPTLPKPTERLKPPERPKPPKLPSRPKQVVEVVEEEVDEEDPIEVDSPKGKGKKKGIGKVKKGGDASRGKIYVILIACFLLGSQLYSMTRMMTRTSTADLDDKRAAAELEPFEKELAELESKNKKFNEEWKALVDAENQKKNSDSKAMQELLASRNEFSSNYRVRTISLQTMMNNSKSVIAEKKLRGEERSKDLTKSLPVFAVTLVLLVCTFLKMNWARYVLGGILTAVATFFMIMFCWGLVNVLASPASLSISGLVGSVVGLVLSASLPLAMGALLLKSDSIEAYLEK